jgi:nicotinamide mononucleotide (NMN) deamidase PncC
LSGIIEQIHSSKFSFELAVTGGGTSSLSQLLAVPGASNSLLNGVIPYSFEALNHYLGGTPAQACSEKTARMMAGRAYVNATGFRQSDVFGIGATAAIQTNRQRRGEDRIHVAIQSESMLTTYMLSLDNTLSRQQQESACAEFVIACIARAMNIETGAAPSPTRETRAPGEWQGLMARQIRSTHDMHVAAILPGAFNPPHEGHFKMRDVAEQMLGSEVALELSIENVDKPDLDYFDMEDRHQLVNGAPIIFSRAATFVEKSEVFESVTFVVGIDTLLRIDDKKYYGNSDAAKLEALRLLVDRGHRFLVFGRLKDGRFQGLSDASLTTELRSICTEIPESEFRVDLSSTELRSNL